MKLKSRSCIALGVFWLGLSVFLYVLAVSQSPHYPDSPSVAGPTQHLSLLNILMAVGVMVTSGLFFVAGAVLALAERLPTPRDGADPGVAADGPHEHGASSDNIKPA
jgi:hypothetical protein